MVATNNAKLSMNVTFSLWPVTLAMTLVQSLSVITSCVPYLKPFFLSLESGMIRSDDIRRRGGMGTLTGGYTVAKKTDGSDRNQQDSSKSAISQKTTRPYELQVIASTASVQVPQQDGDFDAQSHSSRTRFITQTRTWGIVHTEGGGATSSEEWAGDALPNGNHL